VDLDLEAIVGPLSAVMSFAGKTDGHAWMLELAPQIVPVAKRVLGHQFGAAVLGAAIAVLDVRRTHRAFVNAGVIPADSRIDLDDDDGFVGCPAVRAFIREEITTVQAVDVVVKAISMANLIGAAGNLLGVFLATAKEAPESSSRKS